MAPIVGQNGVQISLELFNYSGNTDGERARNFSATPQIGLQPVKVFLLISEKDIKCFRSDKGNISTAYKIQFAQRTIGKAAVFSISPAVKKIVRRDRVLQKP